MSSCAHLSQGPSEDSLMFSPDSSSLFLLSFVSLLGSASALSVCYLLHKSSCPFRLSLPASHCWSCTDYSADLPTTRPSPSCHPAISHIPYFINLPPPIHKSKPSPFIHPFNQSSGQLVFPCSSQPVQTLQQWDQNVEEIEDELR